MDTTKQHPLQGAQESDDLIAELARLVARDARNQSANSAVYAQPEPEPSVVEERAPEFGSETQAEPEAVPERAEPSFDFGLVATPQDDGAHIHVPEPQERDEIADLIASAELYDAPEDENDDLFVDPPGEPEAPMGAAQPAYEPDARFSQPAPAAQPAGDERDPLSEIEALIGEAARVSAQVASNGGRKVHSSFLGTADYQDMKAEHAVDAAESAILAAASASGMAARHEEEIRSEPEPELAPAVDSEPFVEDAPELGAEAAFDPVEAEEKPLRRRRRGGFFLPIVGGVAIMAVLVGGYFFFLAPTPLPTDAPVLTADGGEFKEVPETTGTPTTASESVIFNEIDGNTVAPENEALVSRDQTGGATGPDLGSVLAPEEGEVALANRPVRTVTVRPDGTLVSSDDGVAGSTVLPVDRPDVPTVPNSTLTADPIGEAIAAAIAGEDIAALPETPVETVQAPEATTTTAAVDPAAIPRPVARPDGLTVPQTSQTQTQPVATAPQETALSTPAPAASPVAAGNIGAWVQLASQRTEHAARADIPSLQSRYGALFSGTALDVSRVDLGDRGIYYRVRLPQPTMAEANAVCDAIKGQGGDCFVMNN